MIPGFTYVGSQRVPMLKVDFAGHTIHVVSAAETLFVYTDDPTGAQIDYEIPTIAQEALA